MIYGASFFEPQYHWGRLFAIVPNIPMAYRTAKTPILEPMTPSARMVRKWRVGNISDNDFEEVYRRFLEQNEPMLLNWFRGLKDDEHITLLSYERASSIDHRSFALEWIRLKCPRLYGGNNIPCKKTSGAILYG